MVEPALCMHGVAIRDAAERLVVADFDRFCGADGARLRRDFYVHLVNCSVCYASLERHLVAEAEEYRRFVVESGK